MNFNFDIVLLIVAIFSLLTGLYFGFYNQFRRTLSTVGGFLVALFVTDILANIIGGIGSLTSIIAKVVKIFFSSLSDDVATKLVIGVILFFASKLIIFAFIGLFKRHDVKSFLKDKTLISSLIGGVLGMVDAYIIGLMLFMLFMACGGVASASISQKLFYIFPKIKEILEAMAVVAVE